MLNGKKVFVIIMAGGKGTRIGATEKPKAMFDVAGKPLISHAISPFLELKKEGVVDRIITVVGFLGDQIIDFLGDQSEYVWQKEQLGTAHAVKQAENLIAGEGGITLITNGDHALYSKETFKKMLDTYESEDLTLAFAVAKSTDRFDNYGRVIRNVDGRVERVAEPPAISEDEAKIGERSCNVYAADNKWLFSALSKISPDPIKKEYYINALVKVAIDGGKKVDTVEIADIDEAMGVNTPEELEKTESVLQRRR